MFIFESDSGQSRMLMGQILRCSKRVQPTAYLYLLVNVRKPQAYSLYGFSSTNLTVFECGPVLESHPLNRTFERTNQTYAQEHPKTIYLG